STPGRRARPSSPMLTLPPLQIHKPRSVGEALQILQSRPGARVLAGGTDIVPNLKYGMYDGGELVALRGLSRELRFVREEAGEIRLGALCTLDQISQNELIIEKAPALADACGQIAGPQ